MLNKFMKTVSINAVSTVDDTVVLNMRANIAEDGSISFGKNVRNAELYVANMETCDSDYAQFEKKVLELV